MGAVLSAQYLSRIIELRHETSPLTGSSFPICLKHRGTARTQLKHLTFTVQQKISLNIRRFRFPTPLSATKRELKFKHKHLYLSYHWSPSPDSFFIYLLSLCRTSVPQLTLHCVTTFRKPTCTSRGSPSQCLKSLSNPSHRHQQILAVPCPAIDYFSTLPNYPHSPKP